MDDLITDFPVGKYMQTEANIIMFILDQEGYVLAANQYTKDITGYDAVPSEKHLYDILVDFGNLPAFSELIRDGKKNRMLNISTTSGLPQTFYFNFYRHRDRIIAFGQLNRLEIEVMRKSLLEANNEINNLARELHKNNAELTQLNALKNQFLGVAAHDLRNPIGVVMHYSTFLLDDSQNVFNTRHVELLIAIKESSRFMLKLLDDLLDIAKIESGKLELTLEPTDIAAFVERNVAVNQILAAKKQIILNFEGAANLPGVNIDRSKIEQVLNNLISNAIKYSFPETTVFIRASLKDAFILLSVKDEGQGIPEDEVSMLFQAFQTTSVKTTGDAEKSTGLGLVITKKIITGHAGKIWFDSQVGKGSTFYFTLPIAPEELRKMKQPAKFSESPAPQKQSETYGEAIVDPCLDHDIINKYRKIDPGFFNELAEMFLEQMPATMAELGAAHANQNWERVTHLIDQIRGAAANLGAYRLEQFCDAILKTDRRLENSTFEDFMTALSDLYKSASSAMRKLIK